MENGQNEEKRIPVDEGNEPTAEPVAQETETAEESTPSAELPKSPVLVDSPAEKPYTYRWTYREQAEYDNGEKKKKKKGAWVYAIIMAAVFLACIGVLIGTLLINQLSSNHDLEVSEIAEIVNPGTVLVYASGTEQSGFGTGFFIRSDGYLLTNAHVVEKCTSIQVTLYSGEELGATLLWISTDDDLAILKVDGENYPTLAIGNSDAVKVGDLAVAIGNPAGKYCPWTTTKGIISAVDREISVEEKNRIIDMNMIQTDAQVNPGNSGGPLCNGQGEVIGIVTRKMSDYEGLGLAIPINGAMELVEAFLANGNTDGVRSSVARVRPTLGIQATTVVAGDQITEDYVAKQAGVLVTSVTAGSSSQGYLKIGDILLEINGVRLTNVDELKEQLYLYRAGDTITLKVDRKGVERTLTITLKAAT